MLTLTLWQKKSSGYPTRAGQGRLIAPSAEVFKAAIARLFSMVESTAKPFQIVVQVGDSCRSFQLEKDWTDETVAVKLWTDYQELLGVNG